MDKSLFSQSKEDYLREGTKSLILVNGGGAVALATFLTAMWDKSDAEGLKTWIVYGIASMVFGVAVGAAIPYFRHIAFVRKHTKPHQFWYRLCHRVLPFIAVGSFLGGMGAVALKLALLLHCQQHGP